MTPCDMGSEAAERYVAASMDEAERTSFEDHFCACDVCFRTVQALEDARSVLAEGVSIEPEQTAGSGIRASGRGLPLHWMAAAATVVITTGLSFMVWRVSAPIGIPAEIPIPAEAPAATPQVVPPAPAVEAPVPAPVPAATPAPATAQSRLERWAAVVPPQYVALRTRSGQDQEAEANARTFEEAMTHYTAGRHRQAADGLQALADRAPAAAHVHFFLGISELMSGNVARARGALQRSAEAGVSPYSDEAHFYLAKVALRAGDLTTAARELEIAVDREAGPEGDAARLLAELRRVGR
jgi:Tetratricopeptide repeat